MPGANGSGTNGSEALGASVLVLNRLYMVVHVVGVRRAFGLLFRELAEVIHLEEGKFGNHDFRSWREISELPPIPVIIPTPIESIWRGKTMESPAMPREPT